MKAEMNHLLMFLKWLVYEEQNSLFARSDIISIQELGMLKEMQQPIIRRLRHASFQTKKRDSLAENVGSFVPIKCNALTILLTLFFSRFHMKPVREKVHDCQ